MGIKRLWCSATDSGISSYELEMKRNKKLLRILQETVCLIILWEAADHTHRTAVTFLLWKNWLKVGKVNRTHICQPGGHFEHTL